LGWRLRGGLSILARSGNHHLGLLTFVVLVIAMLVQPISGALSDRWVSRWGKRRPLILFGTIFDFVFLAILGWVGGLSWLALGYIGLQLSSNLARGPLQGLMPDKVPPEQLGIGSGIKNLIDMLGLVLSSLFWGRLLDPAAARPSLPLTLIIGLLAAAATVTLIGCAKNLSYATANRLPHLSRFQNLHLQYQRNLRYQSQPHALRLADHWPFLILA
jgi:Na+/melibiose symporter-like transporter